MIKQMYLYIKLKTQEPWICNTGLQNNNNNANALE